MEISAGKPLPGNCRHTWSKENIAVPPTLPVWWMPLQHTTYNIQVVDFLALKVRKIFDENHFSGATQGIAHLCEKETPIQPYTENNHAAIQTSKPQSSPNKGQQ